MAVVLEIEVSEPFGCRGLGPRRRCDQAQVDRELDELYDRGVRSSLLLNKFDNPLTGVRFDSGPIGVLINGGNSSSAGSFWSARDLHGPAARQHDLHRRADRTAAASTAARRRSASPSGTLPAYPPAPHCNTRGLTDARRATSSSG